MGLMNKNDLVLSLASEYEFSKAYAQELVDFVLGSITSSVEKGEEVALHGFGRFKVSERAARKGRNPQTGEAVKIPASKRVKFEAAKTFKESVNKKRRASKKAA
jgi:DNA-binding protein HU-beta